MSRYEAMIKSERAKLEVDEDSIKPASERFGKANDDLAPKCPVHKVRMLAVTFGEEDRPWWCPSCLCSYPDPRCLR